MPAPTDAAMPSTLCATALAVTVIVPTLGVISYRG